MPAVHEMTNATASSVSVTCRSGQNSPVLSTSFSSCQTFTGLGSRDG